eukprot:TRINITY_DN8715_c0_g1_i4.p1 TRINITY_DN8715_c0_g1~~TRINITY_DN8715_c0_g1_i4.p1  ORF type:complete len:391 (+),score=111.31 TRINITY_DN8715_c0_g1_i4:130-1302(+)
MYQYWGSSHISVNITEPGCCNFTNGTDIDLFNIDIFLHNFQNNTYPIINFSATTDLLFYNYTDLLFWWHTYLTPPLEYSNRNVTFLLLAVTGGILSIDGTEMIDTIYDNTWYFDMSVPKNNVTVYLERKTYFVEVKFMNGDGYGSVALMWDNGNGFVLVPENVTSLFPPSREPVPAPSLTFKDGTITINGSTLQSLDSQNSSIVINGDTTLSHFNIDSKSLIIINGNLSITSGVLSGTLVIHGNLIIGNTLLISLPNTQNIPLQISQCIYTSSSIIVTINETLSNPKTILTYNCPSKLQNNIIQIVPSKTSRDNSLDCNGDGTYYKSVSSESSVSVLGEVGSGCGVGVYVIGGIVGGVLFILAIVGLTLCILHIKRENRELKRLEVKMNE